MRTKFCAIESQCKHTFPTMQALLSLIGLVSFSIRKAIATKPSIENKFDFDTKLFFILQTQTFLSEFISKHIQWNSLGSIHKPVEEERTL